MSKFCGAIANLRALAASGTSVDNEIYRACDLYKHTARDNKPFKYIHYWRTLRAEAKWQDLRAKAVHQRDPSTAISEDTTSKIARPPGVKATQAPAHAAVDHARVRKRLANATALFARASMRRVRALEDASELALFATRLDTLNDDARGFFQAKRALLVQGIRAESATEIDDAELVKEDATERDKID